MRANQKNKFSKALAASVVAILTSTAVDAQRTQEDVGESAVIEEVIVTAQKREQAAQDISISLYTITADVIEQSGIKSLEGIRDIAAGLDIISDSPGVVEIAMRGVTTIGGNITSTSAIGYYLDETPIGGFNRDLPDLALWDAERVEVLRGPQGTLFGEGSMGGTIRIISNKPDATAFDSRVQAEFNSVKGGDTGWTGRAMLNVPIVDDSLALRVNFAQTDDGGWVDVPELGLEDTNTVKSTDASGSIRWTPNENLILDATFSHHKIDLGNTWGQTSPGLLKPSDTEVIPGSGWFYDPVDQLAFQLEEHDIFNLTIEYDFGFATLVSATSYFDQTIDRLFDFSPVGSTFFGKPGTASDQETADIESFTQELRLVSNGNERLNWVAGAFYKKNDRFFWEEFFFVVPDFPFPGFTFLDGLEDVNDIAIKSWAAFAEIEYQFSDSWSGQLGGRYYEDDREHFSEQLVDSFVFGTIAGTTTFSEASDSHFSPKAVLTWKGDDRLVFGSISNGFRGGGTNRTQVFRPDEIPGGFGPEEVWAYELGFKSTLADGRVQLNAYIYLNDWKELQLGTSTDDGLLGFTVNVGEAEATGGELELMWLPTDGLTWIFNAGYVDATIKGDVFNPQGGQIATDGNRIPIVPEWSWGTTLDYRRPLSGDWNAVVHLGYSYRGKTFSDPDNLPSRENGNYSNASLRLGAENTNWGVTVFATNLFDEKDTTFKTFGGGLPNSLIYSNYVRPRTIGLELRWNLK